MREVKLAATLKRLVDEGEYRGNRKRVSTELGITTAALSQYINGQTMPSLEKLVAIADLFKVSLDYLMFSEDAVTAPTGMLQYGPLARFVEAGFSSVRADIAAESAFVAKIGTIVTEQIEAAARAAAKRPATLYGMLDKEQLLELERHSTSSTIFTTDLDDDIVKVDSEIEQGVTAGNFLTVVAENISKKRTYHYILSPDMPDRELLIRQFRALLLRENVSEKDLERCKFSVALDTVYVGFCFFELDVEGLKNQSPVLFQYVRDYIGSDGRIGYIEPPSSPLRAYFLVDTERQRLAARALARLVPKT
ncbi:helix-turn-helix domain-containing protein [Nocardia altamirensis]|uniref:helix-turn-helix domain-containing protein n=1 Tax=Nocardia altamirensis TaxID=472158 RepID=UPI000840120E|nr:transcriptional regulator [Nocardia altamirensis]